jgi:putative DNA primase/helicase
MNIANEHWDASSSVFPCVPNTKKPITSSGYKDASNDPDIVQQWWGRTPSANIGLPTGSTNNIVVVDVDVKNGADGLNSLQQLQDDVGKFDTYTVVTPSGGYHYYFKHPGMPVKNRVNLRNGIDIRGDGGYVLAVGSVIDNKPYTAIDPSVEVSQLPQKLYEILIDNVPANDANYRLSIKAAKYEVSQGARNDTLFRWASSLVGQGVEYEQAKVLLIEAADNCKPVLQHTEALQVLDSAFTRYQPNINLTDAGNADRLLRMHDGNLRYVAEYGKWIHWGGHRWLFDDVNKIINLAELAIKQIVTEAQDINDEDTRRKLIGHSLKSESRRSIESMEYLARYKAGITVRQSELDANPMLLGVQNGVLDLRTGLLRDDDAQVALITKQAPVAFMPGATCPSWLKFVGQITGGDADYTRYIQRSVGYSLTGDTREQVLFFLYGIGANGKSTFINTIQKLLGDYSQQSASSTFMAKQRGSINNDVARLRGSRMVATTETEEGSRFDEAQLKLLTGGDMVTCRFLHKEHFEFCPAFKLWISGNHKPYIKGSDEGIWRRIKLLPFESCVAAEDQDKELPNKLYTELSGILNWAIDGCLDWQKNGLGSCSIVDNSTSAYRADMDIIRNWIDECCSARAGVKERAAALYDSYKYWASESGEWQMSARQFSRKLIDIGVVKGRDNSGSYYIGLSLNLGSDPLF